MSPTATSQQKEASHYWAPPLSMSKDQHVSPLQKVIVAPQEGSEKLTACEHKVLKEYQESYKDKDHHSVMHQEASA